MIMKTDWRQMPAGRELDRVVAENLGRGEIYTGDGALFYPDFGWMDNTGWITPVPQYITSLEAARELMINIDGQAEGIFMLAYWPKDDTGRSQMWRATCLVLKYEAWSDNPATAICKAWLSWRESAQSN
jgi:hypothetical protein